MTFSGALTASLDELNRRSKDFFPELLDLEIIELEPGRIVSSLTVSQKLLAPNGYMHAGAAVTLADTTCGYGVVSHLPSGAYSFTTIELKSNFLGTAREGKIICEGKLVHAGRTTQVWDAVITSEQTSKTITLFRCTQLLLYK